MRFVGAENITKIITVATCLMISPRREHFICWSWNTKYRYWLYFLSTDIIGWDYVMVSLFHLLEIYLFWRTISLTAVGIDLFPVGLEVVDL